MFTIRTMLPRDFNDVADLIYLSTNSWYQKNRGYDAFVGGPDVCQLFCKVYEDLDPGCAIVAEHSDSKKIIGSAFVHPRETHISLGIVNVHPSYFSGGVASAMMDTVISFADHQDLPLRLVSSALNLDSFSLYSRKGFHPFSTYQDVMFSVPEEGISNPTKYGDTPEVRDAQLPDVLEMGKLEFEISGISREQDYFYFVENVDDLWKTVVVESESGSLDGFLVSIDHPGSRMIGPGIARTPEIAAAMVEAQLDRFRGKQVVCLAPVDQPILIESLYQMGGRNCEIHFAQVRGDSQSIGGVVMPSFMPETA